MKTKYILTIISMLLTMMQASAINFTWLGNSSNWADSSSWLPAGIPGLSDNITLNSNAPNHLVLDQNRTVTNFTINGDTIDLGTYTLITTGVTYFNGGKVQNGALSISGTLCHFGGGILDVTISANCGYYHMNGGIFKKPTNLISSGSASTSGTGNCVFEDSLSITHSGVVYFTMGSTSGDSYQNLTITNHSTHEVYIGSSDTTFINGNLVVNNTSTGGVVTGFTGGVTYLATGKTISIGGSGFSNNYLTLKNFYQQGSTAFYLQRTAGTSITEGVVYYFALGNLFIEQHPTVVSSRIGQQTIIESQQSIIESKTDLAVFPNPSTGSVRLKLSDPEMVISIAEIYNAMGEKLFSQRIEQNSFQLDMSSFGDGFYFARCMDNKNGFYMKPFNILK